MRMRCLDSYPVDDNALNYTVDYAVGAGAVWIQTDAQAEMITEQLGREDFIGVRRASSV